MCLVSPINKKSIIILIFRIIKQSTQMFRLHHHRIQISMKKREVIFTKEGHGLLSYNKIGQWRQGSNVGGLFSLLGGLFSGLLSLFGGLFTPYLLGGF